MNKDQGMDKVHMLIHAGRLIPKYSPTELERRFSHIVLEVYGDTCDECKEIKEKNKLFPPPSQDKGVMGKIGELFK